MLRGEYNMTFSCYLRHCISQLRLLWQNTIDGMTQKTHLFFRVLEAGKSKIKVSAPGENPIPGLQMATFSLCPHGAEKERGSKLTGVSSCKGAVPMMRNPTSSLHLKWITSQSPHLQITSYWRGSSFNTWISGNTNIQSTDIIAVHCWYISLILG